MKKSLLSILVVVLSAFLFTSTGIAKPPADLYKAELKGSLVVGQNGNLMLKIVPAKGFKWNKAYPAKLVLSDGSNVSFPKKEYKQLKGEMKPVGKDCAVEIAARGAKAGAEKVDAVIQMSICNEVTCHVLRKEKLTLAINVK